MEKLFIIIVTYNATKWLSECLRSTRGYSVIVVDNDSNDETVKFIKANYPEIILLEQTKNLGFGAANNIGISYALKNSADYVLLLNQDAYLETNTIKELIDIHKNNVDYGVLSPVHLNGKGNKLDIGFSEYISYANNNFLYFDALKGNLNDVYKVPFVNAACWLIPKSTLNIIGGFDPLYFHYGEDVNYCHRLNYHSLKIGVVPHVFVKHDRENRKNSSSVKKTLGLNLEHVIEWSNINLDGEKAISERLKKIKKYRVKDFLKLKFNNVTNRTIEIKLINQINSAIFKSRKTNKIKGSHYL